MATQIELDNLHAVVPLAQASAVKWGVPASITLAQWMLESAWGQSELTLQANNCFGIKSSSLALPATCVEFPTAEFAGGRRVIVQAHFARYASLAAGFDAHAKLLATSPRYRTAMASSHNVEVFAQRLQACGYSTNPNYAQELLQLVQFHDLTQYDGHPSPSVAAAVAA
jgi:flagellum-specific peptidoglycan hydrolase FlgJ